MSTLTKRKPLPHTPDPSPPAPPPAPTDGDLVRLVQAGDLAAFDDLVRRHLPRANLLARRLMQNREDAEDLVQEAFMRALDRIALFDPAYAFAPWFGRLLTNLGLNALDRRNRRTTVSADEELPSRGASPAEMAERSELRERIAAAIATLPPRQRLIVSWHEVDGLSTQEIAEQLEVAPETVRWHLHQARRTLRIVLAQLKEDTR